jgi:hypothetical protein
MGVAQFISAQLAAYSFTTGDEIKLQAITWADVDNTIALGVSIRVVSGDGSTVRGILYEGQSPSVANGNRSLGGSGAHVHVQNSVSMQNGDRIVVELGGVQTVGDTGFYVYLADDGATDLPESDSGSDPTLNSWAEFSATLEDYAGSIYAGSITASLLPATPTADLWHDSLLKWCAEGASSIGNVYLKAAAQPSFYLGLYTNSDGEPAVGAVVDDLDEPSGANGYARIALADGDWMETSQGTFTNLQKTFTCATSAWGDVYGWFITTAASGVDCDLITVEEFSDGPYDVAVADTVKVTPKLTFT